MLFVRRPATAALILLNVYIFEILHVDTFFFQKIDISQTHESNIFEINFFMFMKYFPDLCSKFQKDPFCTYTYAFKTPIINLLVNFTT